MTRSPRADLLSRRFQDMSLERDRLLAEGTKKNAYNSSGYHHSMRTMNCVEKLGNGARRPMLYRGLGYEDNLNHSSSLHEERLVGGEFKGDILSDDDRLPFSYRRDSYPRSAHVVTTTTTTTPNGNHIEKGKNMSTNNKSCEVNCRWITVANDKDQDCGQVLYPHGRFYTPPAVWNSNPPLPLPQVRPSSLLVELVNSVALCRGAQPPVIPPEVIIAFENYVRQGSRLLKFVSHDAPHERFFVIKFLDYTVRGSVLGPVLCWYAGPLSQTMRRCLPLANLIRVIDGGDGHPAVQKRMVVPGVIRGSPVGLKFNYLRADYILQWHFRSPTAGEEIFAVKCLCKQSYIAWRIVTDFFSKIGTLL